MPQIDPILRSAIHSALWALVQSQPGKFEIPDLIETLRSEHSFNPRDVHFMIDDELEFGKIELDGFNRLVPRRDRRNTSSKMASERA